MSWANLLWTGSKIKSSDWLVKFIKKLCQVKSELHSAALILTQCLVNILIRTVLVEEESGPGGGNFNILFKTGISRDMGKNRRTKQRHQWRPFFSHCCANSVSLALLWSGLLSSTFTHPCVAQIYVNNSLTALIMCLSAVAQTHFLQVSTSLVQCFLMCERSSKQKLCLLSQTTDFHKHSHTHTHKHSHRHKGKVFTHTAIAASALTLSYYGLVQLW